MKKQTQSVRLLIDSRLEDTVLVAMAMRGLCSMTGLAIDAVNRIELCTVEIMNNSIEHSYRNESGHTVEVLVDLSSDKLEIVVSDWGVTMDVAQKRSSEQDTASMDVNSWGSSGRGLNIVEQLMDDVRYDSFDGKNSFYMSKKLN